MKTGIILFMAVLLGGCSSGSPDQADDEPTPPPPSDGLASYAAKSPGTGAGVLTGILSFDDIEGGCSFLEAPDGRRYEVVYPAGWSIDRQGGTLRGPGGEVAPAGATVEVHGSMATDRSSTCQIGPIFVATAVELPPS